MSDRWLIQEDLALQYGLPLEETLALELVDLLTM